MSKIVILGGTGMLGHQLFKYGNQLSLDVEAIVRNKKLIVKKTSRTFDDKIHILDEVKEINQLEGLLREIKPDFLINCIGIVKQSPLTSNYAESIAINSLLPHQLEGLGVKLGFRLIHISTDCVFDGQKGMYKETDQPNAIDLYGKSKHLGEVNYGVGITLRTSIIGHEITNSTHGLIEWFLSQEGKVNGFTKAIFSGLTTLELSKVIFNYIIPSNIEAGLYQVASNAINKFDLLSLTAKIYK
ncbi:MAG: SDR family oxidoreductase, partial [Ignavibacteria bacterium]|nr:SDR family oxidoreductase [Ignavibacteria bacterium]